MYVKRLILSMLAIVLAATTTASPVFAFDVGFYASNDILWYDPEAAACTALSSIPSSGTIGSSVDESKNAEAILRFLTGKGLTLAQASGFLGNMKQESGLNPAIIQGGAIANASYTPVSGVGFGLVQWTFTARQKPLMDLAKSTNRTIIDMGLQLDYVWQEVNGTWKATIQALTANPSITPTEAAIIVHGRTSKTMSDPRFANAPLLGYEASNDTADGVVKNRGGAAEAYYTTYKGKIPDGTGVGGTSTTSGPATTTSGSCSGSSRVPTEGCPSTKPIYGEGGNNKQLKQVDLEKIYGKGGNAADQVSIDFLGKSVQVHKLVAPCLQEVIEDIKSKNIDYTIKEIGGFRTQTGAGGLRLEDEYHYYGAAIDINASTNPFDGNGISRPYDMPQEYVDSFHSHGFSWGGNWTSVKNYMHFEFNALEL